jgi:hypothetical protein
MRFAFVGAVVLFTLPAFAAGQSTVQHTIDPEIRLQFSQSWNCQPRKTCGKIRSCDEAEWYLYNCSWGGRLDGDDDGAPCENLCGSNN